MQCKVISAFENLYDISPKNSLSRSHRCQAQRSSLSVTIEYICMSLRNNYMLTKTASNVWLCCSVMYFIQCEQSWLPVCCLICFLECELVSGVLFQIQFVLNLCLFVFFSTQPQHLHTSDGNVGYSYVDIYCHTWFVIPHVVLRISNNVKTSAG